MVLKRGRFSVQVQVKKMIEAKENYLTEGSTACAGNSRRTSGLLRNFGSSYF